MENRMGGSTFDSLGGTGAADLRDRQPEEANTQVTGSSRVDSRIFTGGRCSYAALTSSSAMGIGMTQG